MMFGIPGAALAMVHTAKPAKKKVAIGLVASAAIAAFVCGVTEPFEFGFMFLAPVLYVIYALPVSYTHLVVMHGTPKEVFSQEEKLKKYRLDVPQVTMLADELRKRGLDIPKGILKKEELVEVLCRLN